jgi:hypothetical protein
LRSFTNKPTLSYRLCPSDKSIWWVISRNSLMVRFVCLEIFAAGVLERDCSLSLRKFSLFQRGMGSLVSVAILVLPWGRCVTAISQSAVGSKMLLSYVMQTGQKDNLMRWEWRPYVTYALRNHCNFSSEMARLCDGPHY